MHFALRLAYEATAGLARALATVAPDSQHKLVATFAARRGAVARFERFARERRDATRPLLWMHAPSVGEGLQARPVLEIASERMPQLQRAYTWFSPSAARFGNTLGVDFADVLPFDSASHMRRVVAALAPTALVFSKLDVWPTLAREAAARGVRIGLVSATLPESSSRRSRLGAALLREAYARLDRVGAVSAADADRLIALGVPAARVSVTGDTRFDQVWERARAADPQSSLLAPLASERPTVVAGSTWPEDEAVLLPAWARVVSRHPGARLVIAPHEPTARHLVSVEQWAAGAGLRLARLSTTGAADADVVLVDRVGVLGDLYALAAAAYVGGGFHSAGLHSVLEPAAFGVPVLFGPRHRGSRDAGLLLDADAAARVDDIDDLADTLDRWLEFPSERQAAGASALGVVRRGLGAVERSFALVRTLLDAGPAPFG
ncbi:MAG: hypothetical protein H0W68_07390 [Gemmatimonadaceae bacterium]|nr:hypothetical protein [Gemmatimonadaceae bacterium]